MPRGQKRKRKTPSDLDEIARARIIRWRQAARLTQKEVGRLVGRSGVWVSRYEGAYFNTDLETLRRLAGVFHQTLFTLLDVTTDATERLLVEGYRAIPTRRARAAVLALVDLYGTGTDDDQRRPVPARGSARAPATKATARAGHARAHR
jgi:transcriptional regulator with XRE-family HTH domain